MSLTKKIEHKVYARLVNKVTNEEKELDLEVFTIGRVAGDWIVSDDPKISKKHAIFYFKNGKAYLEDLGATNPIAINGLIMADFAKVEIQNNFELRIGMTDYIFLIEGNDTLNAGFEIEADEIDLGQKNDEEYTAPTMVIKVSDFKKEFENEKAGKYEKTHQAFELPKKKPIPIKKVTAINKKTGPMVKREVKEKRKNKSSSIYTLAKFLFFISIIILGYFYALKYKLL